MLPLPATRLRRLQTNAPLTTILMVAAIASNTSTMTRSEFSSQLINITSGQSAIVEYVLRAADPYFAAVETVTASSLEPVPAPVPATVTAPVPAPVKAPAPAVIVPGPLGFNNPTGVKVSISIATLWFIAVTLGLSILFFYPEEKVPENWKAVSK